MATLTPPRPNNDNNNNHGKHPLVGRIIEKLKRRGHVALTETEKALIVNVFRACAMTNDPKVRTIRDDIQRAHLFYCLNLPCNKSNQTKE
jgi:hypothetical protein